MSLRIRDTVERGAAVTIHVDGEPVTAYAGESLAAALLGAGIRTLRHSPRRGEPRGFFCHMGACQECLLRVDGTPTLACRMPVRAGLTVETGRGLPT